MSVVSRGRDQADIAQSAKHCLFVEGQAAANFDGFDRAVIRSLLDQHGLSAIQVENLGPCDNIWNAARALHHSHPSYYFLIDRDARAEELVERSWRNFPDPSEHNILIWRRRELENYFLDIPYLSNSQQLKVSVDELTDTLCQVAESRLYLEALHIILYQARHKLRLEFPSFPRAPEQFTQASHIRLYFQNTFRDTMLEQWHVQTEEVLTDAWLDGLVQPTLDRLTGGRSHLIPATGSWQQEMSGKELYRALSGPCFDVRDRRNRPVQGEACFTEVAKHLVSLPLDSQPEDFQMLVQMLRARITV